MKDTGRPYTLSWVAALIGYGLLIAGVFLAKAANSTVMVPGYFAAIMVVIMAKFAIGRTRLEKRRQVEAEQLEEYRRTHGATDLFEDADEAVRIAARASEHYTKYFVPVITVLLGILLIVLGTMRWTAWNRAIDFPLAGKPLAMAAISFALFLGSIIAGSFFVGVSRESGCRWLRCPGAWMFFTGAIFLANALVLASEHFGRWTDVADIRAAKFAMAALIVLGCELLASVVVEFYRPRIPGEEERPLPESRILSLFTEPGSVARNFATTLDYQFGFRISEAKFYRFLERTVAPFAALLVLLLWLQTCLVVVNTNENGMRERFGIIKEEPLTAGLHFKLPHPFEKLHLFNVHETQKLDIGYDAPPETVQEEAEEEDDGHGHGKVDKEKEAAAAMEKEAHRVVTWSRGHMADEQRFIVASKLAAPVVASSDASGRAKAPAVSVYYMSATIPLHFRVRNLYDYKYRHADAAKTLGEIASRELTNYFAGVDFFTILTSGREEGAAFLAQRIQAEADRLHLGIEVVYIGMHGMHPPTEVGAAFDRVSAASEQREEIILKAETDRIRLVLGARGKSAALLSQAEAYRADKTMNSAATAERFAQQLLGFQQSPRLFVLNSLLDVFENKGSHVRKFVVAANTSRQVFILDLLEKVSSGMLTMPVKAKNEDENKN
jgi:modulator of FtsH protease HflK